MQQNKTLQENFFSCKTWDLSDLSKPETFLQEKKKNLNVITKFAKLYEPLFF